MVCACHITLKIVVVIMYFIVVLHLKFLKILVWTVVICFHASQRNLELEGASWVIVSELLPRYMSCKS